MNTKKKTLLERILVVIISVMLPVSSVPATMLNIVADETTSIPIETNELPEELTYQTISTSPEEHAQEVITLNGMMPADASVIVQNNENLSEDTLCAYDISITDSNGKEFQPENHTSIKVEITNTAISEATSKNQKIRVWHINDDGIREEIKNFKIEQDSVSFETPSFSIFEIDNGVPPLRTYYFEIPENPLDNTDYRPYYFPTSSTETTSGNSKMICQQTVKDGEMPIFPQLPADISSQYTFVGWFVSENGVLSEQPYDFNQAYAVTQNEEVTLRAVFKSCVYAIFHDEYNGTSQRFPVFATRRGDLTSGSQIDVYGNSVTESAEIAISDLSVNYDDKTQVQGEPLQMAFKGWTVVPEEYQTQEEIKAYTESSSAQVIQTDTIRISETTRLYPVFEPIRWLEFNTNQEGPEENAPHYTGATYKPPLYFSSEEGFSFSGRTPPILAGYTFDGWYADSQTRVTDADLNLVPNLSTDTLEVRDNKLFFKDIAGQPKTIQVALYAHWKPAMSKYTVVIWKQNETDAVDIPADERTWDFEASYALEALTGTNVSVTQNYENLNFTGFSFDTADSAKTVRGDGKTILNVYYKRNTHTFIFKNGGEIHRVQALYGSDISGIWNFTGSDGYQYPRTDTGKNTSWKPSGSNTYKARITQMLLMPNEDITFTYEETENTKRIFHYYVEALPETENTRPYSNRQFIPYNENLGTVEHDFKYIFYNDDFFELQGFSRLAIATAENSNVTSTIQNASATTGAGWQNSWNSELYFYYTRNSYEAQFVDSFNNNIIDSKTILFQQNSESFVPETPTAPEGYEFTGWYADEACSTPVAFTEEEAENYRNKGEIYQDYIQMPAHPIRVYAGWQTQWFKIEIDPNGGALTGSQSTWFWEPYQGDPIEEYKTSVRNFEPDINGNYYYALRNRAYYGLGEEWTPEEDTTYKNQVIDGLGTRGAFYTTDISLATSSERYRQADGAYRYLGWYEVNPVTGEETPYNFGTYVTKNTYLRLHWKQLGTYYISYHAGTGTIDAQDSNEKIFEFLDDEDYADHANVVITRVAIAPDGMNFVGWKIRNDPSETIYYPGQSFQFSSSFASSVSQLDETGNIVTKRIITLDAVYQEIRNAKIIYDPNGGTVDSRALEHGGGQVSVICTEGTEHPLTTEFKIKDNQLIVSDLMNNSAVQLADGIGFSNPGYTFIGWSTTPNGENGSFFKEDSIRCYVDTDEPIILYAQWEFRFYFDKNNSHANWGGDWTESDYLWCTEQERYYVPVRLGTAVSQPEYIPVSDSTQEMFKYWSFDKQTLAGVMKPPFDFSIPITKEMIDQYGEIYTEDNGNPKWQLTLYGCWDAPIEIPIHIVDVTNQTWVKHDDWLKSGITHITLKNEEISFITPEDAKAYADETKIAGKEYVFACTAGNHEDDYLTLSEEQKIQAIKYDAQDMEVKVKYVSDNTWHNFDTSDAVYLLYYASEREIPVSYQKVSFDGTLAEVTPLNSNAPTIANISTTAYKMQDNVTRPLAWARSTNYQPSYYSYAIGDSNAETTNYLHVITESFNTDNSRPNLQIRNTWKGFQYSLNGSDWQNYGSDIKLYVLYYDISPVIVNLTEKTIGLPEDMSEEFAYQAVMENKEIVITTRKYYYKTSSYSNNYIEITNNNNYSPVITSSETGSPLSSRNLSLSDSQSESFLLFHGTIASAITKDYTSTGNRIQVNGRNYTVYYQEVTTTQMVQAVEIQQTPKAEYLTSNDAENGNHEYQSSYTATANSEPVIITYTNTHQMKRQIHVAVAKNGSIQQCDTLRTQEESVYTHTFGNTWNFFSIDTETLLNDTTGKYSFCGIIAGTENEEQIVTPAEFSFRITTLSFGAVSDSKYDYYLNNDNTKRLQNNEIYFVYFERPTIQYMLKSPKTGELIQIGSLQKNGTDFMRNGSAITQNELLPVSCENELLVSQISTPGNPAFLIPDLLDHNEKHSELDLSQISIKNADGSMRTFNTETISLCYADNALQYYFGDANTRYQFSDELIVYAVYQIRGYTLTLQKKVAGDASNGSSEYSFRIFSDTLQDGDYYIGGYGENEMISASDHEISLTLHSGDSITLYGLLQGDYTITEEATGNYRMTAFVNGQDAIVNGNTLATHIDNNVIIKIVNIYPIPVTGAEEHKPYLLINFILLASIILYTAIKRKEENSSEKSML